MIERQFLGFFNDNRDRRVFVVRDERGETDFFEAWSMEALDSEGNVVWVEGIAKDREMMDPMLRRSFEQFLNGTECSICRRRHGREIQHACE